MRSRCGVRGRGSLSGDGRGKGGGRGRGGGQSGKLRKEDSVATKYETGIEPSSPLAPVLGWNSTTQL